MDERREASAGTRGWLDLPVDHALSDPEVGTLAERLAAPELWSHVVATCALALARDYLDDPAGRVLELVCAQFATIPVELGEAGPLDVLFAEAYGPGCTPLPEGWYDDERLAPFRPRLVGADGTPAAARVARIDDERRRVSWGLGNERRSARAAWVEGVAGIPGTRLDGELGARCYETLVQNEASRQATRRAARQVLSVLEEPAGERFEHDEAPA